VKISEDEVRYVAGLANLSLNDEEVGRMQHDLQEFLTHFEKINELDTETVEPMSQVLYEAGETATLREDIEVPSLSNQQALGNAPKPGGGYFKVPRVIER
jgi:aspartyl-tRNA(Asn)/glutamyl-tRNA(Gln) amidotransferase subunit C